jgi:dTDP-4-amino-4,6-dideoxygalactose transaminase
MSWRVPLTRVSMPEEDVEAVLDCLRSGWLTMGPRTAAFEEALAAHIGAPHVVAVSSGTAALHLAMRAAGIGPGDEVIVPALTFVATAAAVRCVGAEPVFCDILGPHDFNVDVKEVEAHITSRTRAVVAVHFMGYPADVIALRDLCDTHGLQLIEDAAQAIGAVAADGSQVGTIGEFGCFSFFPKKQLCVGEGGMVVTSDEARAADVRRLRSHAMTSVTWDRHRGHAESYDIVDFGFNYRIDEPRAALGLSRLPRLNDDIERRRRAVLEYRKVLGSIDGIEIPWTDEAVRDGSHFAFAIVLPDRETRDRFRTAMADSGIQTTWYPALPTLTAYQQAGSGLDCAIEVGYRHCALPLSSGMSIGETREVAERVKDVVTSLL